MKASAPGLKPPLKYPGGKRFLAPAVRALWLNSNTLRLVEPFSGGLSISLGIQPDRALLNDRNPHVINFYKCIKKGLKIDLAMKNEECFYYKKREEFNGLIKKKQINTQKSACLFYYLNRTGFNGLVRFNKSGLYNVPFGRHVKINYKTDFREYAPVMKNWRFRSADFSALQIKPSDFLYVDPPYDVEFRAYSTTAFKWADQERLVDWLADKTCPVVVSNQATERIIRLYKKNNFSLRYLHAPRMISCNGDRSPVTEVLAVKNLAAPRKTRAGAGT